MLTGGDKDDVGHQRDHCSAGAHRGPSRALSGTRRGSGPRACSRGPGEAPEVPDERHPGGPGGAGDGEHRHPRRFSYLRGLWGSGAGGGCGGQRCRSGGSRDQRSRAVSQRGGSTSSDGSPAALLDALPAVRPLVARRGRFAPVRIWVRRHRPRWSAQLRVGRDLTQGGWRRVRTVPVRSCQGLRWTRQARVGPEDQGSGQAPVRIQAQRARVRIEAPGVGVEAQRVRIEAPRIWVRIQEERIWVRIEREVQLTEVQALESEVRIEPDPELAQQVGSAQQAEVGHRTSTRDRTQV